MIVAADTQVHLMRTRLLRIRDGLRARVHRKFAYDVALLRNFVPRGGVCGDVGANHGRFAVELLNMHGGDCRVLAFEPIGYNQLVVRRFLGARSNVKVFEFALSDRSWRADMYIPIKANGVWEHGSAFMAPEGEAEAIQSETIVYAHQVIEARTLDDVLATEGEDRLDFVKIDVQGHEMEVLLGAERTITRDQPTFVIEMQGSFRYRPDYDAQGPMNLLAKHGYLFYDLDLREGGSWESDPDRAFRPIAEAPKHHDVLCWHPQPDEANPPAFAIPFAKTRYGT